MSNIQRVKMVHPGDSSYLSIEQMVSKITASGKISRADQQQFMAALLSQAKISATEQALVNRVFELLRAGRLRVVD
jgi:peptidoglycan hydrolase CwlO-like protein